MLLYHFPEGTDDVDDFSNFPYDPLGVEVLHGWQFRPYFDSTAVLLGRA